MDSVQNDKVQCYVLSVSTWTKTQKDGSDGRCHSVHLNLRPFETCIEHQMDTGAFLEAIPGVGSPPEVVRPRYARYSGQPARPAPSSLVSHTTAFTPYCVQLAYRAAGDGSTPLYCSVQILTRTGLYQVTIKLPCCQSTSGYL